MVLEVSRDAYGRYSLNDLHRAAVASGANARTKEPGKFLSSQQIIELVAELIDPKIWVSVHSMKLPKIWVVNLSVK